MKNLKQLKQKENLKNKLIGVDKIEKMIFQNKLYLNDEKINKKKLQSNKGKRLNNR